MLRNALLLLLFAAFMACKNDAKSSSEETPQKTEESTENSLIYPEERQHFKSIRQITFGGDNAEAYWSFDDKQLIFQSNNKDWNVGCDQMFLMNLNDSF